MITLKTLPQATAQEVYDQVKTHLLTQNQMSLKGDRCMYRGPNGLKCAAGILIGDDEYSDAMEGVSWPGLIGMLHIPDTHELLIRELQMVHDWEEVEDWA
jgi:hypothetical protein